MLMIIMIIFHASPTQTRKCTLPKSPLSSLVRVFLIALDEPSCAISSPIVAIVVRRLPTST